MTNTQEPTREMVEAGALALQKCGVASSFNSYDLAIAVLRAALALSPPAPARKRKK